MDEFSARVQSCRAGLGVVDAYVAELFGKLPPLIATTAEEAEAARRKRNRAGIQQHCMFQRASFLYASCIMDMPDVVHDTNDT